MAEGRDEARFDASEVLQIASNLTQDDPTFLIRGQATNLWAWHHRDRDGRFNDPMTSRDIDFYGSARAAETCGSPPTNRCTTEGFGATASAAGTTVAGAGQSARGRAGRGRGKRR